MPRSEPRDRSEILHRILEQEVRRGYDDGTVIGGLEQFLANWQAESAPESAKNSQSLIAIRQVLEELSLARTGGSGNRAYGAPCRSSTAKQCPSPLGLAIRHQGSRVHPLQRTLEVVRDPASRSPHGPKPILIHLLQLCRC